MDDTLIHRLKQWLTPERSLPVLDERAQTPCVQTSFRLFILQVDGASRGLLDAESREAAFERLRDRLFPNLYLRLDAADVDELEADGSSLRLTPRASVRWLKAAARCEAQAEFSFLYSPFAIVLDGQCQASGWVVPSSSRSPFPYSRLHASFGVQRVNLRFVPGLDGSGASDDPATALRRARL